MTLSYAGSKVQPPHLVTVKDAEDREADRSGISPRTVLVVCMLVFLSPIRNSEYGGAFLLLGIWLTSRCAGVARKAAGWMLVLLAGTFVSIALDGRLLHPERFATAGPVMAVATLLPLVLVICRPTVRAITPTAMFRLRQLLSWFLILESALGVFQYSLTHNSDAVGGTFDLAAGFGKAPPTIGQVHFSACMLLLTVTLSMFPFDRLAVFATVAAVVGIGLAQTSHQILLFTLSVAAVQIFDRFGPKSIIRALLTLLALALVSNVILPRAFTIGRLWANNLVRADSPRASGIRVAWRLASGDLRIATVGAGLGQYSSRAALYASGEYGSLDLRSVLPGEAPLYVTKLKPLMHDFVRVGQGSAVSKPYSSITSLMVELGFPLLLVLLFNVGRTFFRSGVSGAAGATYLHRRLRTRLRICGIFLLLLATVENYLEFPATVLSAFALYCVAQGLGANQERVRAARS
jgi:hypothetical protein